MKLTVQKLKYLLEDIQNCSIKQIKVIDNNFELLIKTLTLQSLTLNTTVNHRNNFHKYPISTEVKYNDIDFSNNSNKTRRRPTTNTLTIVSPMVGTFYRAASPEEPPFIKVLDKVHFNQIVCIIEAMKLMNEVEAELSGQVIDILVEDGEFVDCGQPLMIVKPTTIL
uniref:Biotin carboxyl carrier protein of acetyl-CoA carboxylase n=1 Tax=Apophlaea sinclairii TaxID=212746 RepID=A0A1C9CBD1_9FLOR|nr:acetyl-CoA carboxylase biotin carboxyl carrier protein [Apophlaea sinclairii]AOM65698.1 acetyl-CoA carboxylase biotin carboxyl carrier protein [Apophlaea sinclairii]